MRYLNLVFILVAAFLVQSCTATSKIVEDINLRVNQVGYLPGMVKFGMAFAKKEIESKQFKIVDAKSKDEVFTGKVTDNLGSWGKFGYHYRIDFTEFNKSGSYFIEMGGKRSGTFKISKDIYASVADSLIEFLQVQRCGPTNPRLHKICHLYDSPIVGGDSTVKGIDVTGGWHDAGDYLKFLNTSCYTTYMLLLTYELNTSKAGFDDNKNNTPDILEEARVGIDWLVRCNYANNSLINQVQDMRDHDFGWRLPENDTLKYDRPAYKGIGKNLVGMYSATLALASRIWRVRFHDDAFANKLLATAQKFYALRYSVPDLDQTNSGMYMDKTYYSKLALGAVELYNATGNAGYINEAKELMNKAGSDYWWSWGDINALAHFRIAQYFPEYGNYILNNLNAFNNNKNGNLYNQGAAFSWGTTHTMLGIVFQAMLWSQLTNSHQFDSLIVTQLDYIFGKNPWGLSFVYQFGTNYAKHFHSQVAYFNKGYLPGAIAAGPAPKSVLDNYKIDREDKRPNEFNSDDVFYFDDRMDYITNEPTIVTNATAIFVFTNKYILGE